MCWCTGRRPDDVDGLAARGCFTAGMSSDEEVPRIVSTSRDVAASADRIFELIAEPTQQPRWDGHDNLTEAAPGQRVREVGAMFTMTTTKGQRQGESRGRVRRGPPDRVEARGAGAGPAGSPLALGARPDRLLTYPRHADDTSWVSAGTDSEKCFTSRPREPLPRGWSASLTRLADLRPSRSRPHARFYCGHLDVTSTC